MKNTKGAAWNFKAFLIKFLTAQGGVIASLISMRVSDPWTWAQCLFMGFCVGLGIDTTTWLTAEPEKPQVILDI